MTTFNLDLLQILTRENPSIEPLALEDLESLKRNCTDGDTGISPEVLANWLLFSPKEVDTEDPENVIAQKIKSVFARLYPLTIEDESAIPVFIEQRKKTAEIFFKNATLWQIKAALSDSHSFQLVREIGPLIPRFKVITPRELQANGQYEQLALWHVSGMTDILGTMTALRELHIERSEIHIPGVWPVSNKNFAFLCKLTSLEKLVLDLSYEGDKKLYFWPVAEGIQDNFLPCLQSLTRLFLTLSYQEPNLSVSSICELKNLTNLKVVFRAPKDRFLVVKSLFISSLATSLQRLHLHNIRFSGVQLRAFETRTALKSLSLSEPIDGEYFAETLGKLTNLRSLNLRCRFLEKPISFSRAIDSLSSLARLKLHVEVPTNLQKICQLSLKGGSHFTGGIDIRQTMFDLSAEQIEQEEELVKQYVEEADKRA